MNIFERKRIDFISKNDVIEDLRYVAAIFKNNYFRKRDFDKYSKVCKSSKVISTFGSWNIALNEIGIFEESYRIPRKDKIDDELLIHELIRIWKIIGHRPSKTEWESMDTKYSYSTYKNRFEGWVNACNEAFRILNSQFTSTKDEVINTIENIEQNYSSKIEEKEKRTIPLKIRLKILKRDHYKCVLCGRSPANDHNVELHIDHINPFSKDGKTEYQNLQTLCKECNLGKGNDASFGSTA